MAVQVLADADLALSLRTTQLRIDSDKDQASICSMTEGQSGGEVYRSAHSNHSPPAGDTDGWNCWICSSPHHLKNQCPHNQDRTPPEDVKCWQCDRYGHYFWQCLGWVSSPNDPEWSPSDCMECGGNDHFAAQCPVLSLPRFSCDYCVIHGRTRGIRQLYVDEEGRTRCKEDQDCSRIFPSVN